MDFQAMVAVNSSPEVVEEPIKEPNNTAGYGETPCEHNLPDGTDQFPEIDLETISLLCEPGTVVVDDGGLETPEKVVTIRLLPQVFPPDPVRRDRRRRKGCKCGVSASLLEKSSQALGLWKGEQPLNDGEPLPCLRCQETPLPVLPQYGPRSVQYFCCNCSMGPQVWQVNPFCSYCHVLTCSGCSFSTD